MHRRRLIAVLLGPGCTALMASAAHLRAQDQAPSRRDLTITIRDFSFTPDRIEVVQDDLVRLTLRSADTAHSFNIDEYRIAKRIPAGGMTVVEFRADRTGTFPFYCNLTSEPGHSQARGQLIVRAK
jgi:heme/copper-type cytochrome/quinol oxidase subunit 2